jgi:hypothetical protein
LVSIQPGGSIAQNLAVSFSKTVLEIERKFFRTSTSFDNNGKGMLSAAPESRLYFGEPISNFLEAKSTK